VVIELKQTMEVSIVHLLQNDCAEQLLPRNFQTVFQYLNGIGIFDVHSSKEWIVFDNFQTLLLHEVVRHSWSNICLSRRFDWSILVKLAIGRMNHFFGEILELNNIESRCVWLLGGV
jgi:hypothetical protein